MQLTTEEYNAILVNENGCTIAIQTETSMEVLLYNDVIPSKTTSIYPET